MIKRVEQAYLLKFNLCSPTIQHRTLRFYMIKQLLPCMTTQSQPMIKRVEKEIEKSTMDLLNINIASHEPGGHKKKKLRTFVMLQLRNYSIYIATFAFLYKTKKFQDSSVHVVFTFIPGLMNLSTLYMSWNFLYIQKLCH
jgi:hypothetical protein